MGYFLQCSIGTEHFFHVTAVMLSTWPGNVRLVVMRRDDELHNVERRQARDVRG